MDIRIGFGIDVHRLEESKKLIIGGIEIESQFGAVGHSDADVLLHAICDALLGAAGLRDIGYHFVIGLDGEIEEGRPIEQSGAHTKGHNFDSIGIFIHSVAAPRNKDLKEAFKLANNKANKY